MISNYLKITCRNLKKRLGFVVTNVIGLSTGITCCLLLLFHVSDENGTTEFIGIYGCNSFQ